MRTSTALARTLRGASGGRPGHVGLASRVLVREHPEGIRTGPAAFLTWLAEHEVEPFETRRAVTSTPGLGQLEAAGARPATVARRLAAVSSFYAWCADEGQVEANPAQRARRPQAAGPQPHGRARPGRACAADRRGRGRRASGSSAGAAPGGQWSSGVRRRAPSRSSDLTGANGHRVITIRGKGSTEHRAPLPPQTLDVIDAYFRRPDLRARCCSTTPATSSTATTPPRIVRRLARRAGITMRLSPHGLRHSAVTAALDAGVPLRDVQDFARHADPRTTRRYDTDRESLDRHAAYDIAQWLARAPRSRNSKTAEQRTSEGSRRVR